MIGIQTKYYEKLQVPSDIADGTYLAHHAALMKTSIESEHEVSLTLQMVLKYVYDYEPEQTLSILKVDLICVSTRLRLLIVT